MNNILIFNKDLMKYRLYVQQFLKRFKNYELHINLKKCKFDIDKINF